MLVGPPRSSVGVHFAARQGLGYPPPNQLPIIPRQRNPAKARGLHDIECRCSNARSKTDLYFQELFGRQPRGA